MFWAGLLCHRHCFVSKRLMKIDVDEIHFVIHCDQNVKK